MRPFIKYVGGKSRLLPELTARMPAKFGRYIEPFVGGGALFFQVQPQRATLSDINADLIELYRAVASDIDAVVRDLVVHKRRHDRDYYYKIRTAWNARSGRTLSSRRAAMFIYLNRTCFNGLYRVNAAGAFNVPMGRYDKPKILFADELYAAHDVLKHAELRNVGYADAVVDAERGDFVYFDPPYDPISATSSFAGYTPGGFGRDSQAALANVARELTSRGVHVMLSNNDTPLVRKLYKEFRIDRVPCGRSISSNGKKRGAVYEVIITGKPAPTRAKPRKMTTS